MKYIKNTLFFILFFVIFFILYKINKINLKSKKRSKFISDLKIFSIKANDKNVYIHSATVENKFIRIFPNGQIVYSMRLYNFCFRFYFFTFKNLSSNSRMTVTAQW